jgi:hypothetical protein
MVSSPREFWKMAARAFKRIHGYEHDPARIEHQKFMAGWQQGYRAARRKRSRDNG